MREKNLFHSLLLLVIVLGAVLAPLPSAYAQPGFQEAQEPEIELIKVDMAEREASPGDRLIGTSMVQIRDVSDPTEGIGNLSDDEVVEVIERVDDRQFLKIKLVSRERQPEAAVWAPEGASSEQTQLWLLVPLTPIAALGDVGLQPEDFPAGFEQMSLEDLGLSEKDLSQDEFQAENIFIYLYPEPVGFEVVMGFTTFIENKLQEAGVDIVLEHPDTLLALIIGGEGEAEITEKGELPLVEAIGDKAEGLTMVTTLEEGIQLRTDILVFRRGAVVAFAMVMYLEGGSPALPIQEVGKMFDQRILAALGAAE